MIKKYKELYPSYFNNNEYVFGQYSFDKILIYKRLDNTMTSEEENVKERKKYKKYLASHLEISLIFNKFKPEKKVVHFFDKKILYDVEFYLNIEPVFYNGLKFEPKINIFNNFYTGKYIGWYPDGSIKFNGYLRNGMEDGKFINYLENGKIQSIGNMKNGLRNGKWTIYSNYSDYSKNTIIECEYEHNGVLFGKVLVWKLNDKKTRVIHKDFIIKNNVKNGMYSEYFYDEILKKNILKERGNYLNNKKSGTWFYYIDENYYQKINYSNGIIKGFVSNYKYDGTLLIKTYIP